MIKRLLPWFFMLVLGGGAVTLTHMYLQSQRGLIEQEKQRFLQEYGRPVPVIVAKTNLPESHLMTTSDIGMRPISEKLLPPTATDRAEDVLGLVTKVPFSPGEPILKDKLRAKGEEPKEEEKNAGAKLSDLMPAGKRAVTIELSEVAGVGGFIKPGDSVDVLWIFNNSEAGAPGTGEPVTLPILQSVSVLAVDDQMVGQEPADEAGSGSTRGQTVTLALTPEETSFLLYARRNGEIQLSLRAKDEKAGTATVKAASKRALLKAVLGDGAVSEPETKRQIDVFKGLNRQSVPVSQR